MANLIVHGEASEILLSNDPELFDLIVFSPPYDQLRDYHGYRLDLNQIGRAVFHTLKPGGVVAMVIQDQTIKGSKSLTTFRTIVDWCDKIGFRLWECLIYRRWGRAGAAFDYRFRIDHEYIPLFVKGSKPNYFDKNAIQIPCKMAGYLRKSERRFRRKDGGFKVAPNKSIPDMKCIGTIWDIPNAARNVFKDKHPGTFPDQIPYNLIKAFTNSSGFVLDPMVGSGSTGVAASYLNRDFVGIDISKEYCELARQRIEYHKTNKPNWA